MKNGTVKISCALAALALVITAGLSGCGVEANNKNGASPKQNTATSSKNKKQFAKNVPDVAGLPWSVEEAMEDGSERVQVQYTNTLNESLSAFSVLYKIKDDVTDDQLSSAFADSLEASANSDSEDKLTVDDLRKANLQCESEMIVKPGERGIATCAFGWYYATSEDQVKLWDVDKVKVTCISKDGKNLETFYYTPAKKKTIKDSIVDPAYTWPDNDLSAKLPKPNYPVVTVGIDSATGFDFDIKGVPVSETKVYAKACEDMGWQVERESDEDTYNFVVKDGYRLHIYYSNDYISVSLMKAAEQ